MPVSTSALRTSHLPCTTGTGDIHLFIIQQNFNTDAGRETIIQSIYMGFLRNEWEP